MEKGNRASGLAEDLRAVHSCYHPDDAADDDDGVVAAADLDNCSTYFNLVTAQQCEDGCMKVRVKCCVRAAAL